MNATSDPFTDIFNVNNTLGSWVIWLIRAIESTNQYSLLNQTLLFSVAAAIAAYLLYFIFCSLSYYIFFMRYKEYYRPDSQPQPFKGQVQAEITMTIWTVPVIALMTAPWLVAEMRGYSKLYLYDPTVSWWTVAATVVWFIVFTDSCIYWIHRWEHTFPWIYKNIHKPHHRWLVPTPFAALAFHPVDGYAQSIPYHLFVFLFPMNVFLYFGLFFFVQLWTIGIHDSVDFIGGKYGSLISQVINGSMHHTIHHSKFLYNYGQYFTFWDRAFGSHYEPDLDYENKQNAKKIN
ncbi:delta7-sterol 5-desaturase [Acrasis kona]|uniref:Delta7-sterol 5-desaturase n=1 Tax=Acrasis kona TaxID=1008807 RepID=A0AAW2YNV9_9EUKA